MTTETTERMAEIGEGHPELDGDLAREQAANAGAERLLEDLRKPQEEVEAEWRRAASAQIAGAQSGEPQELTGATAQRSGWPAEYAAPAPPLQGAQGTIEGVAVPEVAPAAEGRQRAASGPRRQRVPASERRKVLVAALVNVSPGQQEEAAIVRAAQGKLREKGIRANLDELGAIMQQRLGALLAPPCTCAAGAGEFDREPGPDHARDCARWRPL